MKKTFLTFMLMGTMTAAFGQQKVNRMLSTTTRRRCVSVS